MFKLFLSVMGIHSNMCVVMQPWTWIKMWVYSFMPSLLPEDEQKLMFPITGMLSQLLQGMGFVHLQATKPDTLGNYNCLCITLSS